MKRRIIYKESKATKQTDILCMQVAEELEDIKLKYLDMDYTENKDKFDRVEKFHIENYYEKEDMTNKLNVFYAYNQTTLEKYTTLMNTVNSELNKKRK